MHELPDTWGALCALVFMLGLRHGFDADHLAAIDGLTRLSSRNGQRHARYCGALFSLGHGAVVVAIAIAVALLSERWKTPQWLDATGAWISIAFLLLIGIVNLRATIEAPPGSVVSLVSVKGRFLGRLMQARRPESVAAVGSMFALSFDTVSQSALFAMTATHFGGVAHALTLALLFVLGMLAADGLNGWWISNLITRADRTAAIASRAMSVTISLASLAVASFGIGKLVSPAVEHWGDGKELLFGACVVALIAVSYLLACWVARLGGVVQREPA